MTMRLEVERIVSEWLVADVNQRIATVPMDGGDTLPPQIPPYADARYPKTTVAVFNSVTHPWVGERKPPPCAPALYVTVMGPILLRGEPYPSGQIRDTKAPVKVGIRYLTTNSDTAVARQDGCYTLRAVARSMRELSKSYNQPDTTMVRNGIAVVLGENDMEFWPTVEEIGNARVAGALVVHFFARDGQPEY